MAWQFDNAGGASSSTNPNKVSLAVADQPNRVAVIAAGGKQNDPAPSFSSFSILGGGAGVDVGVGGAAAFERTRHGYFLESAFPAGAGTFEFRAHWNTTLDYGFIAVAVFYNVRQETPVIVASDADSSAVIAALGAGVLLSAFGGATGGGSITTGGTVRANGASPDVAVASQDVPSAGNQTMTWAGGVEAASFMAFRNAVPIVGPIDLAPTLFAPTTQLLDLAKRLHFRKRNTVLHYPNRKRP